MGEQVAAGIKKENDIYESCSEAVPNGYVVTDRWAESCRPDQQGMLLTIAGFTSG